MKADNIITIGGVDHEKIPGWAFMNKPRLEKLHPLGEVYLQTKDNPKFGYVASGYDWLKFPLSELDNIIENHGLEDDVREKYYQYRDSARKYTTPLTFEEWKKEVNDLKVGC